MEKEKLVSLRRKESRDPLLMGKALLSGEGVKK